MGRKPRQTTVQPADEIAALEAATSKANKAIEELREVTREAHEAMQGAKGARAALLQKLADAFDDHAHDIIAARANIVIDKVKEDMDWNVIKVREGIASWTTAMSRTSDYADRCVTSMRKWLEAFTKLADELEREIKASNRENAYVQGVPDRVFGPAREDTREVLGIELPDRRG